MRGVARVSPQKVAVVAAFLHSFSAFLLGDFGLDSAFSCGRAGRVARRIVVKRGRAIDFLGFCLAISLCFSALATAQPPAVASRGPIQTRSGQAHSELPSESRVGPMAGRSAESAATEVNSPPAPRGDTWVPPPDQLQQLLDEGGVPRSLDVLRKLQRQQQLIAARATECTVSVQIGPAQGCGVVITDDGYVLTAAHVAMRPHKSAVLTLADGRTVTASTRGMNRNYDAGLMKIDEGQNDGRPWPHATLGKSAHLRSGMWCIATGHPGGYDSERGMVTRVGRILEVRDDCLVTDCALIGGDSGGPLFDLSGRLIAVHSRIGNDVADNLHVPIDHYADWWKRMDQGDSWGFLPGFKPVLGVRGNGADPQANVKAVNPGSPAAEAGMEEGDVVERFGDVQITDFESLKSAVSDTMPGERVKVWVRREGRLIPVVVEIGRSE